MDGEAEWYVLALATFVSLLRSWESSSLTSPKSFAPLPSALLHSQLIALALAITTGRDLFSSSANSALITSDAAFDEEGAEEVDLSQYERTEGLESEDEELAARGEGLKLGEMSDDD